MKVVIFASVEYTHSRYWSIIASLVYSNCVSAGITIVQIPLPIPIHSLTFTQHIDTIGCLLRLAIDCASIDDVCHDFSAADFPQATSLFFLRLPTASLRLYFCIRCRSLHNAPSLPFYRIFVIFCTSTHCQMTLACIVVVGW